MPLRKHCRSWVYRTDEIVTQRIHAELKPEKDTVLRLNPQVGYLAKQIGGRGMIDNTGLQISDPNKSRHFYEEALAPLGYKMLIEVPKEYTGGAVTVGFGVPPKPDFWIGEGKPS